MDTACTVSNTFINSDGLEADWIDPKSRDLYSESLILVLVAAYWQALKFCHVCGLYTHCISTLHEPVTTLNWSSRTYILILVVCSSLTHSHMFMEKKKLPNYYQRGKNFLVFFPILPFKLTTLLCVWDCVFRSLWQSFVILLHCVIHGCCLLFRAAS